MPDSVCPNATAVLTAIGANTYTWSPSGITTSTISASNVTSNIDYSVIATNTLTTCKNTQVGHIVVRTLPTITTNISAICEGIAHVLTASGGATNSYTWSPAGPSGNNTYSVTPASTTPIVVTGADTHGCTNTHTVIVNATPTIMVNNASTCSGQTVILQVNPNPANPTSISTYTWTGVSSSTITASVAPSTTTPYTVVATDANGCVSNTAISTVTVTAGTQISAVSSSNLPCIGSTYTLGANGAVTYTWTPSSGSFTSLDGNNTQISVTQGATAVSFTVSGTGSCPATATVITINPAPITTLTIASLPTSTTVCNGGAITLTATGASSYTWTPTITNAVTFTPTTSNIYTVYATDANGCVAVTATVNVTVNPPVALTVNSPSICPGGTATLTASGSTTYTWSTTTGGGSFGTTTAVPTVSPQTYTVIGTDGNNCVSAVQTLTVTTFATPNISISANPNNATVCAGNTVSLSGNGGVSYTWTGGIIDGSAFLPTNSQNYTVTGTDANNCKGTATQSVTVNPLPIVTTTSQTICVGNSATLQAGGATTYTWSTLAQTLTITVQPTTTTNYTVAGTDVNNCTNFAVGIVSVNPLPIISIGYSSLSICTGGTVALVANGVGTGGSYVWDNGSTTSTTYSITDNPTTTTVYTVVGTDANSCQSIPQTATVTVNQFPTAQTVTGNTFVCRGYEASPVTLSVQSGAVGYWTGPAPSTATISTTSSASITQGGIYVFTSHNGCGNTPSLPFTVIADSVVANFTANPTGGQTPVTVSYTNTSVALPGNTLGYFWEFGNNATSTQTNPSEVFTAAGVYQTMLIATDNLGCKDTATAYIVVKDVPEVIIIPNIFSPNGDNINDQFFITGTGISNLECKIYDRWGLLLYNWDGIDGFWDGKAKNGTICTEGTYFYLITYTDNTGKSVIKNSFFQLVR